MTATILDGKALAKTIRGELKGQVDQFKQEFGIQPGLSVVLVGEDPASQVYVRNKVKACQEAGMNSVRIDLPVETSQTDLLNVIEKLNADPTIHGILVQLPVPDQIDDRAVTHAVVPHKDVDGFHPMNVGRTWIGEDSLVPCTPLGVIEILKRNNIEIKGKNAVIIGRSNIVGKPMANLLLREHATVTVCHSRTHDLPAVCREADILIAATGRTQMVRKDWIKPGAAVIDVGISFIEVDGKFKQVGDVHKEEALEVAGALSPSPGGPGPMTIAMLLVNTLKAARLQLT
ncbi:MAG: bifunctional methylenetetrahydrofolate dehydrogenase/methenyltetrahydrofolate cyclohydrolase FolD [Candidatus Hinthialibacter antarcticus]|nr:bifunctional methylenetetrahydrofolate dehydrogenase/methenyltetrahydrofolate cyclohydrolase FolD [Candidatus Hinthialibacter antarcticus]